MENTVLAGVISKMIVDGKFSAVKDILIEMNAVDIAQILSEVEPDVQVKLFRLLPKDSSADVFSYLDTDTQSVIVDSISNKELHNLVEDMFIDDAVDFLEEVPASVVTRVLAQANPDTRNLINKILNYPEDSAGSIMTVEMAAFHEDDTAEDAINELRRTAEEKEAIDTCYVIDAQRKLIGSVSLRRLIISPPEAKIKDIMYDDEQLIFVTTTDDQESVAQLVRKYDLTSVPVVDNEKRLVGMITIDDVVDVIQEEKPRTLKRWPC